MSTVFGNSEYYGDIVDNPSDIARTQLPNARDFVEANNFTFNVPENDGDPNYRVSVTLEVAGGSWCSERLWGLGTTLADLTQSDCTSWVVDLDPGTHSVVLSDTYGDGWNGGSMTVYLGGSSIASFTCPSGVKSGDGEVHVDQFTFSADDLPSCDDATACNYPSTSENCVYASPNTDCSGNCVAGGWYMVPGSLEQQQQQASKSKEKQVKAITNKQKQKQT